MPERLYEFLAGGVAIERTERDVDGKMVNDVTWNQRYCVVQAGTTQGALETMRAELGTYFPLAERIECSVVLLADARGMPVVEVEDKDE